MRPRGDKGVAVRSQPAGAGLGCFAREGYGRNGRDAVGHGVIPPMAVTPAAFALFFDVAHFAAGRHLAVPADNAAAGECGEAEKSNKAHGPSILCASVEQVLYR